MPLIVSLISLCLSAATFSLTQRRPRVHLVLPNRIRVSDNPNGSLSFIYLQIIAVNVGRSARAEALSPRLFVSRAGLRQEEFEYVEKSKTVWDGARREVHVEYLEDAAPIIVGPNSVRSEMLTFRAPGGWEFGAGAYVGMISALRTTSPEPLHAKFDFSVTPQNVEVWRESSGRRFAMVPVKRIRD